MCGYPHSACPGSRGIHPKGKMTAHPFGSPYLAQSERQLEVSTTGHRSPIARAGLSNLVILAMPVAGFVGAVWGGPKSRSHRKPDLRRRQCWSLCLALCDHAYRCDGGRRRAAADISHLDEVLRMGRDQGSNSAYPRRWKTASSHRPHAVKGGSGRNNGILRAK